MIGLNNGKKLLVIVTAFHLLFILLNVLFTFIYLFLSLYWSDVTEYGSSLKRMCGNDTSQDQQQVSFDFSSPFFKNHATCFHFLLLD